MQGGRVVGLQFHLEQGPVDVSKLAAAGEAELGPARYVQRRGQRRERQPDVAASEAALFSLPDALVAG